MSAHDPAAARMSDFTAKVLDVAESIPPGRVMSYGDVAEFVGAGGPRQAGRVMPLWGGRAPRGRGVHPDGRLLAGHARAALRSCPSARPPLRAGPDVALTR